MSGCNICPLVGKLDVVLERRERHVYSESFGFACMCMYLCVCVSAGKDIVSSLKWLLLAKEDILGATRTIKKCVTAMD